jgi:hypothetical protein
LTLILLLTLPELAEIPTAASLTAKERTLQRRVKPPKQTLAIPNRAKGPLRNLMLTLLKRKMNPARKIPGRARVPLVPIRPRKKETGLQP